MIISPYRGIVLPGIFPSHPWSIPLIRKDKIKTLFVLDLKWFGLLIVDLNCYSLQKNFHYLTRYKEKVVDLICQEFEVCIEIFNDDLAREKTVYKIDSFKDAIRLNINGAYCHLKVFGKKDGGYVGEIEDALDFYNLGIKPEKIAPQDAVCLIGFSAKEQKWYGWCRAMASFGVGSTVTKGSLAYKPACPHELICDIASMYLSKHYRNVTYWVKKNQVVVKYQTLTNENIPIDLYNKSDTFYKKEWQAHQDIFSLGRGTWTAKTLEDARQMAIDFVAEA